MATTAENFSQFDISEEVHALPIVLFCAQIWVGYSRKVDLVSSVNLFGYRKRISLSQSFKDLALYQRIRAGLRNNVADAKSYVIISQLPANVHTKYVENVNASHLNGFTFAVISIVHLAGGRLLKVCFLIILFKNLWHHLRRLGLFESNENHSAFGSIKQALQALVQQRYLQKDKVSGPEGNTLIYELAERALDNTISKGVKEYISQVQFVTKKSIVWRSSVFYV
ncbi:hypothetical protein RJ639_008310 [Escallonia herrerae]|uniref:MAGE domain-containing protein n=1 Tax=Escallonia herrerae TaxID=1293975 RepID=A0AA89AX49_9ASTE|nr:hypothetical protein RJ639_008310 [Escallonia herrerae]